MKKNWQLYSPDLFYAKALGSFLKAVLERPKKTTSFPRESKRKLLIAGKGY